MPESDTEYLDTFPRWLQTLANDARALVALVTGEPLPPDAGELVVGGLNYLLKSLDLIPDGVEDLGFIDDAFVLRVASALALPRAGELTSSRLEVLSRLASEAQLVEQFLGEDWPRMCRYVERVSELSVRGRTVKDILNESEPLAEFAAELEAWASSYETPEFSSNPRTLVKLRSFLKTKLPE